MTAEGYKTFINGSVMASFMEGIVASILEEKSGAGYGTNCSQLNTVISVIEAMYLCEGMWLFPFCAEDRFFNQPSCIYARAKPRRAKYTHRTKLRFMLCVFRPCRGQIYASVNYKCCRIYGCAGYGNEFVNGHLCVHSQWHNRHHFSKKGGNVYCKKFIYTDVKIDKFKRQD